MPPLKLAVPLLKLDIPGPICWCIKLGHGVDIEIVTRVNPRVTRNTDAMSDVSMPELGDPICCITNFGGVIIAWPNDDRDRNPSEVEDAIWDVLVACGLPSMYTTQLQEG